MLHIRYPHNVRHAWPTQGAVHQSAQWPSRTLPTPTSVRTLASLSPATGLPPWPGAVDSTLDTQD